jgi:hypothetical protein
VLDHLRSAQPEVEIEELEVLTNLLRALQDGVWMIPLVIIGEKRWDRVPQLEELLDALNLSTDG